VKVVRLNVQQLSTQGLHELPDHALDAHGIIEESFISTLL
jgi:hypothetical protein